MCQSLDCLHIGAVIYVQHPLLIGEKEGFRGRYNSRQRLSRKGVLAAFDSPSDELYCFAHETMLATHCLLIFLSASRSHER
jgi:hypothetical protein